MQAAIAELLAGRDRFEPEVMTPKLEQYVDEQVPPPAPPPRRPALGPGHAPKRCVCVNADQRGAGGEGRV